MPAEPTPETNFWSELLSLKKTSVNLKCTWAHTKLRKKFWNRVHGSHLAVLPSHLTERTEGSPLHPMTHVEDSCVWQKLALKGRKESPHILLIHPCTALRWQNLDFKRGFPDLSEAKILAFQIPLANSCSLWGIFASITIEISKWISVNTTASNLPRHSFPIAVWFRNAHCPILLTPVWAHANNVTRNFVLLILEPQLVKQQQIDVKSPGLINR